MTKLRLFFFSGRNQLETITLQNPLYLVARMGGPRAGRIQPDISLPVLKSFARLFDLFESQRQIVVRIGISRRETQRRIIKFVVFFLPPPPLPPLAVTYIIK